jgi:hypothetical protein
MSNENVNAIEKRLAERVRLFRPALAQDVLELANGLTELVHAVRALALRRPRLQVSPGKDRLPADLRRSRSRSATAALRWHRPFGVGKVRPFPEDAANASSDCRSAQSLAFERVRSETTLKLCQYIAMGAVSP